MSFWQYECRNTHCENFGVVTWVQAREFGPYFEYPILRCTCGMDPFATTDEGVVEGLQA